MWGPPRRLPSAWVQTWLAGKVVVLPGLHHLASLEDPNAVNTILLEFIRGE